MSALNIHMGDKEFYQMMVQVHQSVGRIESDNKNMLSYLNAVNNNQKETAEKLDKHIEDVDAHGEKIRSSVWEKVGKIATGLIAAAGGLFGLWKMIRP